MKFRDEDDAYDYFRQRQIDAEDEEREARENELKQQKDYPPQGGPQ
jgi:hypothetical protein